MIVLLNEEMTTDYPVELNFLEVLVSDLCGSNSKQPQHLRMATGLCGTTPFAIYSIKDGSNCPSLSLSHLAFYQAYYDWTIQTYDPIHGEISWNPRSTLRSGNGGIFSFEQATQGRELSELFS